jgi:hypothetical protein
MLGIESMVPGFARMLERRAGAADAWRDLSACVSLGPRELALVSLAVAGQYGSDYARWVTERLAGRCGLDAEEILLAEAGTALEPVDRELVRGAAALARGRQGSDRLVEAVALARLECAILSNLAPAGGSAPARRGA